MPSPHGEGTVAWSQLVPASRSAGGAVDVDGPLAVLVVGAGADGAVVDGAGDVVGGGGVGGGEVGGGGVGDGEVGGADASASAAISDPRATRATPALRNRTRSFGTRATLATGSAPGPAIGRRQAVAGARKRRRHEVVSPGARIRVPVPGTPRLSRLKASLALVTGSTQIHPGTPV